VPDRICHNGLSTIARRTSPSSRGLGRGPFKAETRVRIPVGTNPPSLRSVVFVPHRSSSLRRASSRRASGTESRWGRYKWWVHSADIRSSSFRPGNLGNTLRPTDCGRDGPRVRSVPTMRHVRRRALLRRLACIVLLGASATDVACGGGGPFENYPVDPGTVVVRVSDQFGGPIRDVAVSLDLPRAPGVIAASTTIKTQADGTANFGKSVPAGPQRFEIGVPPGFAAGDTPLSQVVDVRKDATVTVDFRLQRIPTFPTAPEPVARYRLDGYVRDLNTRVGIRAVSVEIRTTSGVTLLQVNTDGDGHFIFLGGVDAGDYLLVFTAAGYEQYVMMLPHRNNQSWDVSLRRPAPGAAAALAQNDGP
jgi:hypothetical protein